MRTIELDGGVRYEMGSQRNPDDLTLSLRPAAGVQYVTMRLDGGQVLEKDGSVALTDDGYLPPYLVLGVDALFGVPVYNKPNSQTSTLDEIAVTVFADFRLTKEIAFRIGVPLKAEIATRKEDTTKTPTVEEKKALQWTLPVFLSTVLEI